MSEFERAVLEILSRSTEPMGWYQIELRLSMITLPERPNLVAVLARLRAHGLVEESSWTSDPNVRHIITATGRATLE